MTTINEEPIVKRNACLSYSEENINVPQQLIEANELLNSINGRLEDCALEWQAEVSREQWKIFNSKPIRENSSEQYLMTRTYFPEKNLDEAFQHLLSCNKIFSGHLNNFIALLRGEEPTVNIKETRDAQNQCSNLSENCNIDWIEFSSLRNQDSNERRKPKDLLNNILMVQNSFTDVIKAKVNFDTKFLGFEAVLHKTKSSPIDTVCFRRRCTRSMTAAYNENKKLKIMKVNQKNGKIAKRKRKTRSSKSFCKKLELPATFGNTDDQSLFETNRSF